VISIPTNVCSYGWAAPRTEASTILRLKGIGMSSAARVGGGADDGTFVGSPAWSPPV